MQWPHNTYLYTILQIRHGDKILEAPNAADRSYLHETNELVEKFPELTGSVYMASLINESINYFVAQPNLTVYYTDVPRIAKANAIVMSVIPDPW